MNDGWTTHDQCKDMRINKTFFPKLTIFKQFQKSDEVLYFLGHEVTCYGRKYQPGGGIGGYEIGPRGKYSEKLLITNQ